MVIKNPKSQIRAKKSILLALGLLLITHNSLSENIRRQVLSQITIDDTTKIASLMKISVDPLSETCLFSRKWFEDHTGTTPTAAPLMLYNITNDKFYEQPQIRILGASVSTATTSVQFAEQSLTDVATTSALISPKKLIVGLKFSSGSSGRFTSYDIDEDCVFTEDLGINLAISDIGYSSIQVHHDKNLIVVSTPSAAGIQVRFYDSLGFKGGEIEDMEDYYSTVDTTKGTVRLFPQLGDFQMVVTGNKGVVLFDVTRIMVPNSVEFSYDTGYNSGLTFSADIDSSNVISMDFTSIDSRFSLHAYETINTADLTSYPAQATEPFPAVFYKTFAKVASIPSITNYRSTRDSVKNIPSSHHYFLRMVAHTRDLYSDSRILLVDTVQFTAATPPTANIRATDVTSQIIPRNLIDSTERTTIFDFINIGDHPSKWIVTGFKYDDTANTPAATSGWAMIATIHLNGMQRTCHPECASCMTPNVDLSETSCVSCINNRKILAPSGCRCAENCLSCIENNNEFKCTTCAIGFSLEIFDPEVTYGRCFNVTQKLQEVEEVIEEREETIVEMNKDSSSHGDAKVSTMKSFAAMRKSEEEVLSKQIDLSNALIALHEIETIYVNLLNSADNVKDKLGTVKTQEGTLETSFDNSNTKNAAVSGALTGSNPDKITEKYVDLVKATDNYHLVLAKNAEISTAMTQLIGKQKKLLGLNKDISELDEDLMTQRLDLFDKISSALENMKTIQDENPNVITELQKIDAKINSIIAVVASLNNDELEILTKTAALEVIKKHEDSLSARLTDRQARESVHIESIRAVQNEIQQQDSQSELLGAMIVRLETLINDQVVRRSLVEEKNQLAGKLQDLVKRYRTRATAARKD